MFRFSATKRQKSKDEGPTHVEHVFNTPGNNIDQDIRQQTHRCASPDSNARLGSLPHTDKPAFDTWDEEPAMPVVHQQLAEAASWGLKEKRQVFLSEFWPAWPRKVSKAAAEKAWCKHATSPELAQRIVNAVRVQLPQLTADLKYCPYPASWLNDKRWEDETTSSAPAAAQASGVHEETDEERRTREAQIRKRLRGSTGVKSESA